MRSFCIRQVKNAAPSGALRSFVTLTLLLFSFGCSAEPKVEKVVEGEHYKKIDSALAKVGPKERVDVLEFFSYGCPHCADLEPGVNKWKAALPSYVAFDHMPAFWNEQYAMLAQAYYMAKILKKEQALRPKIFHAIHNKGERWRSVAEIRSFFEEHGIDGATFDRNFESFAVKQKMKMAGNAFKDYKLRSVPVFVVAGQYVTSLGDAGSQEQLWKVLNHLTSKVKAGEL